MLERPSTVCKDRQQRPTAQTGSRHQGRAGGVLCRHPVTQLGSDLTMLGGRRTLQARHRIREAKVVVDVLHVAEPLLIGEGPLLGVQPLG